MRKILEIEKEKLHASNYFLSIVTLNNQKLHKL